MPSGRVKWFDADKGFGFIAQDDGGEDVHVRASALPAGVTELQPGRRVEFDLASGRRGPQALRVTDVEAAPQRRGGTRREPAARKHSADELHGMINDLISLLDGRVQRDLQHGRFPDRRVGGEIAAIMRAVARELEA